MFKVSTLGSVIIFFGLPSLYLTIRAFQYAKKAIIFSLIGGVPLIIIIDYIAQLTKQWIIPNSILAFRLLGIVTLEVILWIILNIYFVVMFYEYFLDKHVTKRLWLPKMKYFLIIALFLFVVFLNMYFFLPSLLNIPYFYLWFGIILLLVPVVAQFMTHSRMDMKILKTSAYFFYLTFIYEVTALQLGWWDFPGSKFIGWVTILGVKFPIEELAFWIFLFSMAIISYYEFFDDDEK